MSQGQDKSNDSELRKCHAIILAGGSGTRLWPLSRNLFPKQLIALNGEQTLLQQTLDRVLGSFEPDHTWIVTNEEHVFEVRSQTRAVNPEVEKQVLAEPLGRDTLPAIMLALDQVYQKDPEAIAAVFPSDHFIRDRKAWADSLERGLELAREGYLVTFGAEPRNPETGYGYISRGKELAPESFEVGDFVEKPDKTRAEGFVRDGNHFWNSGVFMFRVHDFLDQVEQFTPNIWNWWENRKENELVSGYRDLPGVSVDYGILEKAGHLAVVRAGFDWEDQGSWEALYRLGEKDEDGNVIQGDVLAMGCKNCLLISKGGKLAAVGLEDMIMVQTRDATLTCPLPQVQRVREVVARLKEEGSSLIESHLTVKRPWGSYCVLDVGNRYKIKRIEVIPGAELSLQMHHHRSEHWVVVAGTAKVEVNGVEQILIENQSVDIPMTAKHRLSNPGKVPLEIIEIQNGPYLEEDDIVRFKDVYGRLGNVEGK